MHQQCQYDITRVENVGWLWGQISNPVIPNLSSVAMHVWLVEDGSVIPNSTRNRSTRDTLLLFPYKYDDRIGF